MTRRTATSRDVRAGCFICHGSEAHWTHAGAQGTAAAHHDATGHATWSDVMLMVRYGQPAIDLRQTDIEDAIASSSGDRPDAIPLPVSDAPAVAPAGVSAPSCGPVEICARGRTQPETAHV